ncbi:MAG: ABC-three component system protein [Thalassolituus sp.]
MAIASRNYTPLTLKKLFALAGNQCSFPGCNNQLVNRLNAKDSNICHIEAANPDGERYNSCMTDKERADYDNLILLCIQHHDMTNDVDIYTVEKLKSMKIQHEDMQGNNKIVRQPSMLTKAINSIADLDIDNIEENDSLIKYDIREKIDYNSLKSSSHVIQTYKIYQSKINTIYDELEDNGSIKKIRLLNNINSIYINISSKYVNDSTDPIDSIRQNSDRIFNEVFDELCLLAEKADHWKDEIMFPVRLIIVDAFMRCKIFERPITTEIIT